MVWLLAIGGRPGSAFAIVVFNRGLRRYASASSSGADSAVSDPVPQSLLAARRTTCSSASAMSSAIRRRSPMPSPIAPTCRATRNAVESNQRMEFLGDAVLQLIVTQKLYEIFPGDREGSLSKRRAALTKGAFLASPGARDRPRRLPAAGRERRGDRRPG